MKPSLFAPFLPPRSIALFLLAAFPRLAAPSDAFGPVAFSLSGDTVFTWHDGKLMGLRVEGGMTPVTDSIAVPRACAVDDASKIVAVSPPAGEARVTLYRGRSAEGFVSLLPGTGRVMVLAAAEGTLTVVGEEGAAKFALPSGEPLGMTVRPFEAPPVDFTVGPGGVTTLFSRAIVGPDGSTSPITSGMTGRSIFPAPGGFALLGQRADSLFLELPGGSTRPAGLLRGDETLLGAAWSRTGERLLLVIEMPHANRGNRTSRVDVIDTLTGKRIRFLRSTWNDGGVDRFETPIAAAFHPNGRWLLVNWRLTGIQLWEIDSWELVQHW